MNHRLQLSHSILIAVLAFLSAIHAPFTLAEPPSFTGLGFMTQPSQWGGRATAISSDGRYIIGYEAVHCGDEDPCSGIGWIWHDGQFQSVGSIPGTPQSTFVLPTAVSGNGGTVAIVDMNVNRSYLLRDGAVIPISTEPPNWQISDQVGGVSDDGATAVGGRSDAFVGGEAWRWQDGARVYLGDMQIESFWIGSSAYGISGNGQVVIGAAAAPLGFEAFRWSDGQMSGLGFLRSEIIPDPIFPEYLLYPESTANAASYDGSVIVGNSPSYNTRLFETEAFRWENGVMVGLGDLPGGGFSSEALSVSADGSTIVGWGAYESGRRAFIWDETNGMRLLEDVLAGAGVELFGWTLLTATDISADGTIIVGQGLNPQGDFEPFRAVVPEPASWLLVLIGAAAIISRRLPNSRNPARL